MIKVNRPAVIQISLRLQHTLSRWWVALAIACFLVACSSSKDAEVPERESDLVWVLLPDSATSARWETDDRKYFEEIFEELGIDYNIVNAEGDARTQQTQAEQAITAGAKVLLLVSLDSGSGAAIIAMAREAGVFVVDYDRLNTQGPGADVYVSFNNVAVGATMGTVLEPLIDGQPGIPNVVLLNGASLRGWLLESGGRSDGSSMG